MSELQTGAAEEMLEEAGIRPTPNRILVLREILKSDSPLSLTDLEGSLETLDKSSIFRVITLLAQHHIVHGIEDGRGIAKYEICHGDHAHGDDDMHAHFYCERCERVVCLPAISATPPELPEGFEAHSVNYMIKGICPECKTKNRS